MWVQLVPPSVDVYKSVLIEFGSFGFDGGNDKPQKMKPEGFTAIAVTIESVLLNIKFQFTPLSVDLKKYPVTVPVVVFAPINGLPAESIPMAVTS